MNYQNTLLKGYLKRSNHLSLSNISSKNLKHNYSFFNRELIQAHKMLNDDDINNIMNEVIYLIY